jgi:hypothetical protein
MNTGGAFLSEGCIRELYTLNHCEIKQPIVQLIDFEESETNDKEITYLMIDVESEFQTGSTFWTAHSLVTTR